MGKSDHNSFWNQDSGKGSNGYSKNFAIVLLIIFIAGFGSFTYAKLFHKADKPIKQPPSVVSENITPEDSQTTAPPLILQTPQTTNNSYANNNSKSSGSQNTEIKPVDNSKSLAAQLDAQKALDEAKKAEEAYAQAQAARQARIQQCADYNKQRDAILNPVKQQIYDLQTYMIQIPTIIANQVRGTFCTQSCLDAKISAEQQKTQADISALQLQLNQLSSQYPLCTY